MSVQKGRPIGITGMRVVCRCVRGGADEAGVWGERKKAEGGVLWGGGVLRAARPGCKRQCRCSSPCSVSFASKQRVEEMMWGCGHVLVSAARCKGGLEEVKKVGGGRDGEGVCLKRGVDVSLSAMEQEAMRRRGALTVSLLRCRRCGGRVAMPSCAVCAGGES